MRLVNSPEPGVLELCWMWLPTWMGMNHQLKRQIEELVRPSVEGKPLTEETLEEAHQLVLSFLEQKYPNINGLRDFFEGLKNIRYA